MIKNIWPIFEYIVMALKQNKHDMTYNHLSRRLQEYNICEFITNVARLKVCANNTEWQIFLISRSTNIASFFRERYHFPALISHTRQRANKYKEWFNSTSSIEEASSEDNHLEDELDLRTTDSRGWMTVVDTGVQSKAIAGLNRLSDLDPLSQRYNKCHIMRGTRTQTQLVNVRKKLFARIFHHHLNLMSVT